MFCPWCGRHIPDNSVRCKYCKKPVVPIKRKKPSKLKIVIAIIILILIYLFLTKKISVDQIFEVLESVLKKLKI